MTKKNKIYLAFILVFGISALILCVLGGFVLNGFVDENGNMLFADLANILAYIGVGMLVVLAIYMVGQRIYMKNKHKMIGEKINNYLIEKKYDELIDYLNIQINKRFIGNIVLGCKVNLVVVHLLKEDNSKAKELVFNTTWDVYSTHIAYYKMLFHLADNNIASAKIEYNKLLTSKIKLRKHIELGGKIINMVETNTYSEEIVNSTSLPIVKKLCDRYKN